MQILYVHSAEDWHSRWGKFSCFSLRCKFISPIASLVKGCPEFGAIECWHYMPSAKLPFVFKKNFLGPASYNCKTRPLTWTGKQNNNQKRVIIKCSIVEPQSLVLPTCTRPEIQPESLSSKFWTQKPSYFISVSVYPANLRHYVTCTYIYVHVRVCTYMYVSVNLKK